MSYDVIACDTCGELKPWQRFRLRVGNGTTKEVSTCSTCRTKKTQYEASKKARLQKQAARKLVLNRTNYEIKTKHGYVCYDPDLEAKMRAYCNKRTTNDRKYLRDHAHEPLSNNAYTAKQQQQGRDRAKGWIAFYDEILNHAINLLRQTGTRPPWAQLEGKGDLHRFHGIYNTKRAAWLRAKG